MSNQLVTQPEAKAVTAFKNTGVQFSSLDDAARFAKAVFESGLAPKDFRSPQAVLVAMQAGMELGLAPMRAIQSVAVINGRPTLWGDAMLAIANSSGLIEDIEEVVNGAGDEREAVCTVTLKSGKVKRGTFSVKQAVEAGLWKKAGPWTTYPERMLKLRARSFALRDAVPQVFCGFNSREEVEDHVGPERAIDVTPAPSLPDPLLARIGLPAEIVDEETGEVTAGE